VLEAAWIPVSYGNLKSTKMQNIALHYKKFELMLTRHV